MKLIAAVVVFVVGICGVAYCDEVDGVRVIDLPAKIGNVLFPHERHIQLLEGECKPCHERPGAIQGFGKRWAHDNCIGCHQKEDQPGGPIKCAECHGDVTG